MKHGHSQHLLLALLLVAANAAGAEPETSTDAGLRVLFVGNSLTYTALVLFEQLAGREPHSLPARVPMVDDDPAQIPAALARLLWDAATEANARFARR